MCELSCGKKYASFDIVWTSRSCLAKGEHNHINLRKRILACDSWPCLKQDVLSAATVIQNRHCHPYSNTAPLRHSPSQYNSPAFWQKKIAGNPWFQTMPTQKNGSTFRFRFGVRWTASLRYARSCLQRLICCNKSPASVRWRMEPVPFWGGNCHVNLTNY